MCQWPRTALAHSGASAGSEVREKRVSVSHLSGRARRASTMPILWRVAQAGLAPHHAIAEVIQ
jgi:hypothetical protein